MGEILHIPHVFARFITAQLTVAKNSAGDSFLFLAGADDPTRVVRPRAVGFELYAIGRRTDTTQSYNRVGFSPDFGDALAWLKAEPSALAVTLPDASVARV